MAGSIFKEVTITPKTFDKLALMDDVRKFQKLLNAMDDLSESGMIVGVYTDWINKVNEFIEQYNENDKYEIQEALKFLDDRHRIVHVPRNLSDSNEERDWINQAKKMNQIRKFDLIIASEDSEDTYQINNLDRGTLKYKGAIVEHQSKNFMKNMLEPILSYAEIVKIMDPYFNPMEKRYTDALDIICQTLGNHYGVIEPAIIEIHTSIKPLTKEKEFFWDESLIWPKIIKKFEEKYRHAITIYIWEEVKKENEWHDRWIIIPNKCGVFLGKGFDISESTAATWGLIAFDDLSIIDNKFNISGNRSIFNYIGMINSSVATKKNRPKHTYSKMTSQEQLVFEQEQKRKEEERLAPKEAIVTSGGLKIKKKNK